MVAEEDGQRTRSVVVDVPECPPDPPPSPDEAAHRANEPQNYELEGVEDRYELE